MGTRAHFVDGLQSAALSIDPDIVEAGILSFADALDRQTFLPPSNLEFVVFRGLAVAFLSRLARRLFDTDWLVCEVMPHVANAPDAHVLYHTMATVLRRAVPLIRRSQNDRVTVALAFIDERFCQRLTVADVAEHVKLSRWHLEKLLRRKTGCSFSQHVRRRRVNLAARLLETTFLSVKEISAKCGYPTPSALSNDFRRVHGQSPTRYRVKW